jgi:hypothetical protein
MGKFGDGKAPVCRGQALQGVTYLAAGRRRKRQELLARQSELKFGDLSGLHMLEPYLVEDPLRIGVWRSCRVRSSSSQR